MGFVGFVRVRIEAVWALALRLAHSRDFMGVPPEAPERIIAIRSSTKDSS